VLAVDVVAAAAIGDRSAVRRHVFGGPFAFGPIPIRSVASMPLRVKLQQIVEAIDLPNRDWQSFVNRETGAIVTVTEDMVIGPEGDELNREDLDSDEYLPLPGSSEIDEWSIMRAFADERPDPLRRDLLGALDGRGAFRMFRTVLKRARKEDEWYRFREDAFVGIAKEWLDEHGIAYE
jgi:hypothetical protein